MAAPPIYTIHPPPLPEFYLKDTDPVSDGGSSSLSRKVNGNVKSLVKLQRQEEEVEDAERKMQTVALYEHTSSPHGRGEKPPAISGDVMDEKRIKIRDRIRVSSNTVDFPLQPPGAEGAVPPIAIYHICRVCLRPRSANYHREHPIPIDGVPPPPGICRRCRVKHVGDITTVRQVVVQAESNPVKLGIAAVMPDECYIPGKEWKEMRDRQLLETIERQRLRKPTKSPEPEKKKITYRHIRIRETSPPSPLGAKPSSYYTAQDAIETVVIRREATETVPIVEVMEKKPTSLVKQSPMASELREVDSIGASKSVQTPSYSFTPPSTEIRAPQITSASMSGNRLGYSESNIRKFARDEVERYRQAERKLEAHPDAFAHGRMVPAARRIAPNADVEVWLPWSKRTESTGLHNDRQKEAVLERQQPSRSQPLMYHKEVERLEETTSVTAPRTLVQSSSSSSSSASRTKESRRTIVERVAQQVSRNVDTEEIAAGIKSQSAQPDNSDSRKSKKTQPRPVSSEQMHFAPAIDTELPRSVALRGPEARVEVRRKYEVADDHHSSSNAGRRTTSFAREVWVPALNSYIEIESAADRSVLQRLASTKLPDRATQLAENANSGARSPSPSVLTQPKNLSERQVSADGSQRRYASGERHGSQSASVAQEQRSSVAPVPQSDIVYFVERVSPQTRERHPTAPREYKVTAVREEAHYESAPAHLAKSTQQESSLLRSRSESRHGLDDIQNTASDGARPRAFDRKWEEAKKKLLATTKKASQGSRDVDAVDQDQRCINPDSSAGKGIDARRPLDSKYIYKERIVRPVDVRWDRGWSDKVSSSHAARNIALLPSRQDSTKANSKTESARHKVAKVREWEDASRVRFASKVDISPTPPGSQASSSEFRIIGGRGSKSPLDGQDERGEELIAEYERRGRSRSRVRDEVLIREREAEGLQGALSESPSRERIEVVGREAKVDSYGSYRAPEPRTESFDVQVGSSATRQHAGSDCGGSGRQSAATTSMHAGGEQNQW